MLSQVPFCSKTLFLRVLVHQECKSPCPSLSSELVQNAPLWNSSTRAENRASGSPTAEKLRWLCSSDPAWRSRVGWAAGRRESTPRGRDSGQHRRLLCGTAVVWPPGMGFLRFVLSFEARKGYGLQLAGALLSLVVTAFPGEGKNP